jgi:sarcosine oxidase subunit beta
MNSDIVIIGAGIIGLSTAFQLARRSKARILVLEQGSNLGEGSTGASSAICRHRYSLDEMVELARDGINAYRHWPEFLGIKEPLAEFQNDGVLWLNDLGSAWARVERDRMNAKGISAEVVSSSDVRERFPALNPCTLSPDLIDGTDHTCNSGDQFLFENDGGYFDPMNALTDLMKAARTAGVEVKFRSRVQAVNSAGGKVTGLQLTSGETIQSQYIVNASGPWCNEILDNLGISFPWSLKPTRIQVLHLDRPGEVVGKIPVCCDIPGGIYFREQNQGQQIVIGSTLEEDEREVVDPSDYKTYIDDEFKVAKLHALHHRIPALPYSGAVKGYTGLYTVNQEDVHPIVGESPLEGLYLANGFSGHGFKLAPAIGSLLAQAITGEVSAFDTSVPAEFLSFYRAPLSIATKNVLA